MSDAPITKANFPTMARVLWDFEQEFGKTERLYLHENGVTHGKRLTGNYVQPVIEQKKHANFWCGF